MTTVLDWLEPYRVWLTAAGWIVAAGLVGLISRRLVFRQVRRLSAKTATRLDDVLLEAADRHWPWWFVLGALVPAAQLVPLSDDARGLVRRLAVAAFVLSLSLVGARAVTLWFEPREVAGTLSSRPSLLRTMAHLAVLVAGGLLVLDNLGIEITPLLTALGVGSLAVALALQPTLSNLFAGMHLSMARPIRVGDFVELENGTQGFVEDIGWRTTQLRQPANNVVLVPNAKLADMVLKNYGLPSGHQGASVALRVAYGSDLSKVEGILLDVARQAQADVAGAVREFEPAVRFQRFGEAGIECQVHLQAETFGDQFLLTHELVKRIDARFRDEGIEIPLPQRVVHLPAPDPRPPGASSS